MGSAARSPIRWLSSDGAVPFGGIALVTRRRALCSSPGGLRFAELLRGAEVVLAQVLHRTLRLAAVLLEDLQHVELVGPGRRERAVLVCLQLFVAVAHATLPALGLQ